MPILLADPRRLGLDTVATLERAAEQRSSEAETLRLAGHGLAAIYLHGYSAEIRIKAAYFRFVFATSNLDPKTVIDRDRRRVAVGEFKNLGMSKQPGQHDISGWAQLLISKRASLSARYSIDRERAIINQARLLSQRWVETLRYRSNKPYSYEVRIVREVSAWFKSVYPLL